MCPLQTGVCFPCFVDVVPVKNEEGLVIMFILNFELADQLDLPVSPSPNRELNHKLPIPWFSIGTACLLFVLCMVVMAASLFDMKILLTQISSVRLKAHVT